MKALRTTKTRNTWPQTLASLSNTFKAFSKKQVAHTNLAGFPQESPKKTSKTQQVVTLQAARFGLRSPFQPPRSASACHVSGAHPKAPLVRLGAWFGWFGEVGEWLVSGLNPKGDVVLSIFATLKRRLALVATEKRREWHFGPGGEDGEDGELWVSGWVGWVGWCAKA